MEITIEATLPTLNQYIAALNRNRFVGNKMKRDNTDAVCWQAKRYAGRIKELPVGIVFTWHIKPNRGKYPDPDNRIFSQKFCLDGLVEAGVLPNDTRKEISSITHEFVWDAPIEKVIIGLY